MRFLRFFGATVCNGKETASWLKVAGLPYTYMCMCVCVRICVRVSPPRREFSFHGQKDNPSLCHFSSVFLSHRLIELLRTAATDLCHVSFSPVSVSPSQSATKLSFPGIRYVYIHLFSPFRPWTKLDFVILSHLCGEEGTNVCTC